MERLKFLMDSTGKHFGNRSLEIISKCCSTFIVCDVISNNVWILDSSATNHMNFMLSNVSFLGYTPNKRGNKCYHPLSWKFLVSRYVAFHENLSYFPYPQSQRENISNTIGLEFESDFITLSPNLPRAHIYVFLIL